MVRGVPVTTSRRRLKTPSTVDKMMVTAQCANFIRVVLKPRFVNAGAGRAADLAAPNYLVDLLGKWHGGKFRFIARFRSAESDSEFEEPFARLDFVDRDCFDLSIYRHSGTWLCLYRSISLKDALQRIESDEHFHPC